MKTLLRLFVTIMLVSVLGGLAYAADMQGILLDRMCATKIVQAKDQTAAKNHTRECALMPDCVKSGYGVMTADGKWMVFDAAGNQKAEQALKASQKKNDIRVQVSGQEAGGVFKVTSIKIL